MEEKFIRPVGINDIYYLSRLSKLQEGDVYVPEIKNLAPITTDLASRVGKLGLGEATNSVEPIAFLELNRNQKLVLDQAHELRESGQVFLRAI